MLEKTNKQENKTNKLYAEFVTLKIQITSYFNTDRTLCFTSTHREKKIQILK